MSIFSNVSKAKVPRSAFDLSHEKKLSFKMGQLYPILVEEVVPGDKFSVKSEVFIRLAPMIAPMMHRVNVFVHFFFVPNRLVMDDWEDFITGEKETLVPAFDPSIDTQLLTKGSLAEAFGMPVIADSANIEEKISKLPFRAYNLIYNEYYRDENLTLQVDLDSNKILYRAWEKDYFTSALPFAQKGETVVIPATGSFHPSYRMPAIVMDENGPVNTAGELGTQINGAGGVGSTDELVHGSLGSATHKASIRNLADPQSISTNIDINELRLAEKMQRWLERSARAGSRYVEHLLAFWGIKSSDARINRPEYLGGGKQPVVISEVAQTSSTDQESPQGTLAGHGISVGSENKFHKFFEEHGLVIGIMSVLPKTAYQQGLHKKFTRIDKFDFYFPDFAHLGEQEVKNYELYLDPNGDNNEDTFGYQSRFAEYKYSNSVVTGDFRDTLDFYHMGRKFATRPNLNDEFVVSNPTNRVFAVQDGTDTLWCQVYNKITAVRPMPYYGTPKL